MENEDPLAALRAEVAAEMKNDAAAEEEKPVAVEEQPESEEEEEQKAEGDKEGDKPKPRQRDWKRERINELTAKNRERDAEIARLRAALAEREAGLAPEEEAEAEPEAETSKPSRKAGKTEAEIRAEVEAQMRQDAEARTFAEESNRAFDAGVKTFGAEEFTESKDTLLDLGLNRDILEVMLATDAPEKVLYLLGQDPDEAKRVFALPKLKMATAMAKVASSRSKPAKVSEAPAPIRPLGGKGGDSEELTPNASDAIVEKVLGGALARIHAKYN